jgi:hypothetical protein
MRKWFVIGAGVIFFLIAAPLGWYLASPLFINTTVQEELPVAAGASPQAGGTGGSTAPGALRSGQFHDVAHEGTGTAAVVRLADGKYVLRLEEFSVLNGPDLYVYLSALPDSTDSGPVLQSKYLSVAKLKGNKGNQTYELPADFDPATYNSVVIWCQQFRVNFATAPLK